MIIEYIGKNSYLCIVNRKSVPILTPVTIIKQEYLL